MLSINNNNSVDSENNVDNVTDASLLAGYSYTYKSMSHRCLIVKEIGLTFVGVKDIETESTLPMKYETYFTIPL